MPYRAPELFNIDSECVITEKTDIWVIIVTILLANIILLINYC